MDEDPQGAAARSTRGEVGRDGSRWPKRRLLLAAGLPAAFLLQRFLASRPDLVESLYVGRVYPRVAAVLERVFGSAPVSVAELLLASLVLLALASGLHIAVDVLRGRRRAAGALVGGVANVLAFAGVIALWFEVAWGALYGRAPLERRLGYDASAIEAHELVALCEELRDRAEALRAVAEEDGRGVMRLARGREACYSMLGVGFDRAREAHPWLDGPRHTPKPALASHLMSRLGITGIYSPFTGEPHVNAEVTDYELPFTAAHEMAHGMGFAREDEANFVAYLACRAHDDADVRYSGVLSALLYGVDELRTTGHVAEAGALLGSLSESIRRDLTRSHERMVAMRSVITDVSADVNDAYIRAQGDVRGTASYGSMVRLLIGERRLGP